MGAGTLTSGHLPPHSLGEVLRLATGIQLAFVEMADPVRAVRMKTYMRDQFEFLGIAAGPRKTSCGQVLRAAGQPASAEELHEFARR